jgi:hypothetical protein
MSPPSSAREALIVELMGEVSALLDRVDALVLTLNTTCDAVNLASANLEARATQVEVRLASLTEAAKSQAVRHIARRTQELAQRLAENQTKAMHMAAQAAFRTELAPALGQLKPMLSVRNQWWSHAATAACSSLVTAALIMAFCYRGSIEHQLTELRVESILRPSSHARRIAALVPESALPEPT